MASIQSAESNTPKKKTAPKTLDHLEIHPQLGGGHIVKHVYTGYEHESKEVPFNKSGVAKGGEKIGAHLAKHAGLPGMAAGEANEAGEESNEEEVE